MACLGTTRPRDVRTERLLEPHGEAIEPELRVARVAIDVLHGRHEGGAERLGRADRHVHHARSMAEVRRLAAGHLQRLRTSESGRFESSRPPSSIRKGVEMRGGLRIRMDPNPIPFPHLTWPTRLKLAQ